MASLGWVTPGAASEGVTPLFFLEKPGDLFLFIAVTITIAFYCFHSGVTPSRVSPRHPTFFLPVRPRFSTNLCKFVHNFFPSGVTPLEGVTRGGPPPHLVTPLFYDIVPVRNHYGLQRRTVDHYAFAGYRRIFERVIFDYVCSLRDLDLL